MNQGSFEASRAANSDTQEKLIVWLERDLEHPEETLRVFVLFGLYEKVFGAGFRRVRIEGSEEQSRLGALRQAILDASLAGWN